MKLSILIASWNVKECLLDCLRSIQANPPQDEFEVLVVDNGSHDGTAQAVRRSFPDVTLVANADNRGFAVANNQALAQSSGRYLLLLNPDTIVHPDALDTLIRFMDENDDVGACGPKLLNEDGTVQPSIRGFPTFRAGLYQYRPIKSLAFFRKDFERWLMEDFRYDRLADVDQPMGAALMVRRSVVPQVGALDESFFMFYEEVDWCYRIKQAGWRITFVPDATITHLGARSAEQLPIERRLMYFSGLLCYLSQRHGAFGGAVRVGILRLLFSLRQIRNLSSSPVTYALALLTGDRTKRDKAAAKMRRSALLLARHRWRPPFRP